MKTLIALIVFVLLAGCASITGMGGGPVNFGDGTWSKCQYEKDGMKFWLPIQNAPPIGTIQPDGTVIGCELIPKIPVEPVE